MITTATVPQPARRRVVRFAFVAAIAFAAFLGFAGRAHAAACQTSGPTGGSYTVSVCLTAPADGATVGLDTTVSATVTVTGTGPGVQRMIFYLDGAYLLTDYQAPYTFTLPTAKFVDGMRTLEVEALMRDTFRTDRASINLLFGNGVTTPPTNTNTRGATLGTGGGGPVVVAAVGDGAGGETSETNVTNVIAGWNPNLFLYLGDVYEKGTPTEFYNWYGGSNTFYGRFDPITNPTIGNHEYENGAAPGYFDYWDNIPHYYSYDVGGWHLISLDSTGQYGETAPGTPQYQWLASDLDANQQPCTLVYYHHPLYNLGEEGETTAMAPIWSLLAQHSVDLVVNGHDHTYQRWTPLDGSGNPDATGITEIIAGTGGHALGVFVKNDSRVAASSLEFGALRLDLNQGGAGYQFVNTQGVTRDSGSIACDTTHDSAPPTAPTDLTASATYKTRIDLAWTASTDNVAVSNYDIYRNGTLLTSIGSQTSFADTTVAPNATYTYTVVARDAAGNVSVASNSASATTPATGVLFHDGFESGDLSNWTSVSGLVAQQGDAFAGSWAARATATGGTGAGPSAYKQLQQTETNIYYQTHFKVLSQSTNVNLLRFRTSIGGAILTAFVSSTGKIGYRNDTAGVSTTSTTSASQGAWHTLQVHLVVNGAASQTEVWLDGTKIDALSKTESLGTNPVGRLELGDPSASRTYDVLLDEVAYDREFIGDLSAPTDPSALTASVKSGLEVDLSWTAATDDVGISAYDVFRNNTLIATVGGSATSFADTSVSPLTSYTYKVQARDAAGNESGFSNSVTVTTSDIFHDDFETGNLSQWTTVSGLVAQSDVVDGGTWAARATSTGVGASAVKALDAATGELYYRLRFNIISRSANVNLCRFRTASGTALLTTFVSSTGKLGYRNDTTGVSTTSSTGVSNTTWHELQVHALVNGAASQVDVYLDGVKVPGLSNVESLGTSPLGKLELGDPSASRTFDVAFDNVIVSASFVADTVAPSAPTGLTATMASGTEIDLAWSAASDDVGVTGYRIYRDGDAIGEVDGATTTYADTGLAPATSYSYTVKAYDAAGHGSNASNTATTTSGDTIVPNAPTALTAKAGSGASVDLSWTAATDNVGVTGYQIFRNGSKIADTGPGTTYNDATTSPVTTYTYTVRAVDAAANVSTDSNTASVTTSDSVPPEAPTGLSATPGLLTTAGTAERVDLAWSASTDNVAVTGYQILRGGTKIADVGAGVLTYTDTTALAATTYAYTVQAVDGAGNVSAASNTATATTFVFSDGFESGTFSRWTSFVGLATEQTTRFAGSWAAEGTSNKGTVEYAVKQLGGTGRTDLYYRARILIVGGKPSTVDLLRFRTAAGASILTVNYSDKKKLGFRNDVTGTSSTSTTTLTTGVWYEVKAHVVVNGTSSLVEVWLNGTKVNDLSKTQSLGTTPIGAIELGESTTGRTYDTVFDNVIVDTKP
jgi:chitodextrinase